MTIGRITYKDKIDYKIEGQNEENKITAKDMNEIKSVFNNSADSIEETIIGTKGLQDQLEESIRIMGTYKFENGKVYFMKGDGTWGLPISLEVSAEEFENLFRRVDTLEDVGVQVADTLGIGSVVYLNGENIPDGWEEFSVVPPKQLLINNDFQINQRNKQEYVGLANFNLYTLDMWKLSQSVFIKVVINDDNTITVVNNHTSSNLSISQRLEEKPKLPATIILKLKNEDRYVVTFENFGVFEVKEGLWVELLNQNERFDVAIRLKNNTQQIIEYIDLFEGVIGYHHEKEIYNLALTRCQNFVKRINRLALTNFNGIGITPYFCGLYFGEMREIPTITNLRIVAAASTDFTNDFSSAVLTKNTISYITMKTVKEPYLYFECILTCEPQ